MSGLLGDLRLAVRSLLRRPSLALGITLTIGIGIGATTTIFGIVDGVVLRPLPYDDPGQLVVVGVAGGGAGVTTGVAAGSVGVMVPGVAGGGVGTVDPGTGLQDLRRTSTLDLQALEERATSYATLGALQPFELVVSEEGADEVRVPAARFSDDILPILGVSPALGRTFLPEEFATAGPSGEVTGAALISHGYWQRRYGGDPDVLGTPLEDAAAANPAARSVIVGVLPADFVAPESFFPQGAEPDVVLPLPPGGVVREGGLVRVSAQSALGIGRLAPGATVESARAEAQRLAPEIAGASPMRAQGAERLVLGVNGLHEQTVGNAARSLWIFLGAAALLLLLAILNAAALLLARTLDRSQELGVRTALGARRGRIVRLLLAEAGVLTLVGGFLGIGLAYVGVDAFLRFAPGEVPRLGTIAVDGRVLTAALVVSTLTGLLVGLFPAFRSTARAPWDRLRNGTRTIAESRSGLRMALIGGQVALAVVLLSGAALLFGSFVRVQAADPGFAVGNLMVMSRSASGPIQVAIQPGAAPGTAETAVRAQVSQRWDPVLSQVASVPGVAAVAGASDLPFQAPSWAPRVLLPDDDLEAVREGIAGYAVTPGFFEAMGIAVRRGRGIEGEDVSDAELVVVVNEAFVRTQLDVADALDVIVRRETAGMGATGDLVPMRIVGVVADVVQARASDGPRPAIYIPYTQADVAQLMTWNLAFRTDRPVETVASELRTALSGSLAEPPRDLSPMAARIAATHVTPRFQALLIGGFALVALFLAAMGLYASLAHAVRWREKELGVRMALGADRPALLRMVLGDGMRLAVVGLVVGFAGTLASSQFLASLLYGIEPTDPATLLGVAVVLTTVSAVASLVPARSATAVDPVRVLKSE